MDTLFAYRNRRFQTGQNVQVDPTPENDFLHGVEPLSKQIRRVALGGLPSQPRELKDSNYDEDDSLAVDPMSQFGTDKFERAEMVATMVSDRVRKSKKDKLPQP